MQMGMLTALYPSSLITTFHHQKVHSYAKHKLDFNISYQSHCGPWAVKHGWGHPQTLASRSQSCVQTFGLIMQGAKVNLILLGAFKSNVFSKSECFKLRNILFSAALTKSELNMNFHAQPSPVLWPLRGEREEAAFNLKSIDLRRNMDWG